RCGGTSRWPWAGGGRAEERRGGGPRVLETECSSRDGFPRVGYDEWRALAEADLQGAAFEQKLVTHTYEGIDVQPVYPRRDRPGEPDAEGFPGLPPFVRGSRPLRAVQTRWGPRPEHGHPGPGVT